MGSATIPLAGLSIDSVMPGPAWNVIRLSHTWGSQRTEFPVAVPVRVAVQDHGTLAELPRDLLGALPAVLDQLERD